MSKGVRYMIISSLAFSLMQLCVKFLSHLPFTELVFFRSIVSLILSLVIVYKNRLNPLGNNRKVLVLRGLFGATALSLFFYTLQNLPIATAITINYLSPIFTTIFAIWILREPVPAKRWLFFAISFSGIMVMKGLNDNLDWKYVIAGMISAIFSGLAYNMVRRVKDTDHPVVVVLYFPLVATPIMGIISLFYWQTPMGWDWLFIVLMGVFTQIAQLNMTKAWHAEKAGKVASLKYLGIGFAMFFDYTVFQIVPSWQSLIGIAIVLTGVFLNLYAVKETDG